MLDPHVPTVEMLGRRERTDIAEVIFAACLVRYRNGEDLHTIDPRFLAAAKTKATSYPALTDDETRMFEAALDAALFATAGSAEDFLTRYIEQQLVPVESVPVHVYWLDQKFAFQHLRATLPLEWLERFPQMPLEAAGTLFEMAARFGDREELLGLIGRRLSDPVVESGDEIEAGKLARIRKEFWQLNAYFHRAPGHEAAWQELRSEPKTIFAFETRFGRFASHDSDYRLPMRAENIYDILDAFIGVWPKVHLPDSYGSGDPEEETAYRFIQDCIWKIVEDTPDRRVPVLNRVIADPRFADFRDAALTLRAEAARKIALQDFCAPGPSEVNLLLDSRGVASVEDLRALMVEELGEVQHWLSGADTDPLDAFYSGGKRVGENTARNRIVDQLKGRMRALGLSVVIEHHMAGGNRCDITASATFESVNRLLVIEVKGQWNIELYTAASAQLDQRYAIHPDAARQGVYLALWYGNNEKIAGRSDPEITTAAALKERIVSVIDQDVFSRIDVVVLDLSRPLSGPQQSSRTTTPSLPITKSKRPRSKRSSATARSISS